MNFVFSIIASIWDWLFPRKPISSRLFNLDPQFPDGTLLAFYFHFERERVDPNDLVLGFHETLSKTDDWMNLQTTFLVPSQGDVLIFLRPDVGLGRVFTQSIIRYVVSRIPERLNEHLSITHLTRLMDEEDAIDLFHFYAMDFPDEHLVFIARALNDTELNIYQSKWQTVTDGELRDFIRGTFQLSNEQSDPDVDVSFQDK